jgi:hypothetical protein
VDHPDLVKSDWEENGKFDVSLSTLINMPTHREEHFRCNIKHVIPETTVPDTFDPSLPEKRYNF